MNNKGNCYIWQLNGSDVCPLKMVKASYLDMRARAGARAPGVCRRVLTLRRRRADALR